jgi:hypothetical protein
MFTFFRIWHLWVFLLLIILFSGIRIMAVDKTPQQNYRVVFTDGEVEIRYYPSAHLVKVRKDGEFDSSRYAGFRSLAAYIFGDNQTEQKIAMTAPVIYTHDKNTQASEMSFVLPESVPVGSEPSPKSKEIFFEETAPAYLAVISRGGWPNQKDLDKMAKTLSVILETKNLTPEGEFEYRYYNSPFDLFNRNTEVSIKITGFKE